MSRRPLGATLLVIALLLSAVAAPLTFAGQAASSAPTDVHAVVVGDNGQLVAVETDGTTHEIGVDAAITGRTVDLDDDTVLETPFVDSQGTLKLTEPDGTTTTLAQSAASSKSAIAVGDLDGDGTPAVFYPNSSDSGYIYKVEIGPESGDPTRVTTTAANGVAGVGDLDGDDEPELGFAGSSSAIKYVDDGTVVKTGYSSGIGSNNGYGLGGVADHNGDGTARVSIVTGSNNIALIDDEGNTEKIKEVSAAKSPIAAANWTGDSAPELLYLDSNGKLAYTTLDGTHERILDANGNTIAPAAGPGVAASPGLMAPEITEYNVTNPTGREIRVNISTDKRIEEFAVNVSGPDSTVLERTAFNESGNGPYTYVTTYEASIDGNYTATIETAVGPDGNDGATGQQRSVEIRTPGPEVENATVADATDDDGAVGGNHTVAVSADVPDVDPENVTVTANASAFGAGTVELTHANGSTYETNVTVDGSAVPEDGAQEMLVTAINQYDNDGKATTDTVVVDTTPPDADAGPDVSVKAGTNVTFDGDGSTDMTEIVSYEWELGNGTTATGKAVTHQYDEPGNYTVTLALTDTVGNTATDTLTVTVEEQDSTATATPDSTPTPTPDSTSTEDNDQNDGGDTTVVVVEEDGTSVETRVDDGAVRVDVTDAEAGNTIALSVPSGGVTDGTGVTLDSMTVLPTRSGAFQVSIDGNASAPDGVTPVNRTNAVDPLAYWTIGHSIDDEHVDGATFEFDVRPSLLDGAHPEALTLYRYQDGNWTAYDPQVLGQDGDYRYRVHSPGLSTFAVGVRETNFTVENATLSDETVRPGEAVTATVTVANDGSTDVTRTLTYRLGGEAIENRTVTVPAGERRTVTFVHEPTRTGEFDATVAGELAGTLTVAEPSPTAISTANSTPVPTAVDRPEPPTQSGFGLPFLLLLVVPIGGALGYYYLTRRAGYRRLSERL